MIRWLAVAVILAVGTAEAAPTIVITFDDLPAHGVLPAGLSRVGIATQIIASLKTASVPPTYGVINGSLIAGEPDSETVLKLWRDSGNLLGNHTWSHPGLSKSTLGPYETDTLKNEALLEKYAASSDWHWFRYPFLDEGKDEAQRVAFRNFLAEHLYKIAPVTMSLNDWDYPEPYARCIAKNDTASLARLEALYVKRAEEGADYARQLSATALGRDIPYILLLHIGAFQAHMLPKLITLYKAKGYGFVSLKEASADPYYKTYLDPSLPAPPRSLEDGIQAKGQQPPPDNHITELNGMCR